MAIPHTGWHVGVVADSGGRFLHLLSYEFRTLDTILALVVVDSASSVLGWVVTDGDGDEAGAPNARFGSTPAPPPPAPAAAADVGGCGVTAPLSPSELAAFLSPPTT